MIGNRIMVDDSGAKLIENFENIDKYDKEQHQENQQVSQDDNFKLLKHQLTVKDEQIDRLLEVRLIYQVTNRNDIDTGDCGGNYVQ